MCTEERMKVSTVVICKCGLVMHQAEADDYDTLGAESATCCPDCGNEKFQTIQQLQAELAKLRWIPVTERLPVLTQKIASPVPKESEEVWVSDGKQTAKAYWMGTKHWLFSDGIRLFIVTHWMPIILPEPLKDKDA